MVKLRAGGREVTPIEVSAEILRVLRERAEAELGGPLDGAVITVPAYFDDAQRGRPPRTPGDSRGSRSCAS